MDSLLSTNHWCSPRWFYAKGKEPIERERGKTMEAVILGGKGSRKGQRETREQNWRDLFIRTLSCWWWCIFVNELRPKQKPTGLHNQQWESWSWRWWHPETGCFQDHCLTLLPSRSLSHSHEDKQRPAPFHRLPLACVFPTWPSEKKAFLLSSC